MSLLKKTNNNFPTFFNTINDMINRDKFFESDLFRNDWAPIPAVNMKETEKTYEIELSAPGLDKKDFDVSLEGGILTVKVEKEEKKEETEEKYYRKEFSYQSFHRSIQLPEDIKEEGVGAKYENGVLKVTVSREAKKKADAGKKVAVS